MAMLDIITYPDPRLSTPSERVTEIDDSIKKLVEDMAETMFDAPGVGLAAVQVGVCKQVIVVNTTREDEDPSWEALINPEILSGEGEYISEDEGCLSVPGFRATVKRYSKVRLKALDIEGNPIDREVDGFEAVILQHEIDHLNGTLFIDRISALKRQMYKRKVNKRLKKN